MANENNKIERVFRKLEEFSRKLYLLNEDVATIQQRLDTIKDCAENQAKREIRAIKKEVEQVMSMGLEERDRKRKYF